MDPAFATARHVDQLTDVALPGLPMTDVDRIEDELLAELTRCDDCGGAGWRTDPALGNHGSDLEPCRTCKGRGRS